MEELYKDFLKSLEAKAYKPKMIHKPSDVTMAKKFFGDYLTEEELCERQYNGRFWDFGFCMQIYILYILLDNNTVLILVYDSDGRVEEKVEEKVMTRKAAKKHLPSSLEGYYYV